MKAFHNDPLIKETYLQRLKDHYKADEIIKGIYWEKGKGCAVGCTVHSREHSSFETELGIPRILAKLLDTIFEELPNELAKEFPLQFLSAITVGADLLKVWNYFAIWLLTDAEYGVLQHVANKKLVQDIVDAYADDITMPVTVKRWKELRVAAAAANAYSAAYAAAAAAATDAADAATAYANAAYYAYYAAAVYAANAYAYADYDKKQAWYVAASKKLIELLTETL